ncbi:MAG TPA: DoxX family protein [Chloroflexota bacterium]|nr:DoxX family protein [Chloroflexota bacterium]
MRNVGLLALRLVLGSFLFGHGAQKLFGWFGGPGLKGTSGMMENMGMRPPEVWGTLAASGETTGGILTLLGFLSPLGPLNIIAMMMVAIRKVHWKWPVWNSGGGLEFPLTNLAAALALALTGPGSISVDGMLGTRLPKPLQALIWIATIGGAVLALRKPELVEEALDTVMQTVAPPAESNIEVENRPVQEQPAAQPTQ